MKKILTGLFLIFVALSSQFVMAEEAAVVVPQTPLYIGGGIVELKSDPLPILNNEASYIVRGAGQRNDQTNRLGKNLLVGYKLSDALSFELGYTGGDSGAWAETVGSDKLCNNYDPATGLCGQMVSGQTSIKQKITSSSWQLSVLGEKPLSDDVRLFARVSQLRSETQYETQTSWACYPVSACPGYYGQSSTAKQTDWIYGAGIKARVLKRERGDVWVRGEMTQLPNGKLTSRLDFMVPL